ncbi:MAG: UDP-3-O-(3-hydroxymyristoyl)glucosamine N-acyltransferase [Planctomycetes bacterium]|nr:UDP-3-O-(3-hydroxymyristoyl)glucosamine N-acyltransferase [Planctomycetota bacterium]
MRLTVHDVAVLIEGRVVGDRGREITGFAGAAEAVAGDVTFANDARWAEVAGASDATCIIASEEIPGTAAAQIVVADPNLAFARLIDHVTRATPPEPLIHPDATVHEDAVVDDTARIEARAVVDRGARIGARTRLAPGCYVGEDASIGADARLHPNVSILARCRLGDRVEIWPSTVIGSDGYGYATDAQGVHVKVPQTGIVVVEDDVEIGACVTIDRARMNETRVGRGTKIDNQVQIGHNVKIGENGLLVAQSGVAGSTELGRNVVLGAGAGVTGHVTLGDGAQITAMSGVSKNLPGGAAYMGVPAIPIRDGMRVRLLQIKLPELLQRVKDLERRQRGVEDRAEDL